MGAAFRFQDKYQSPVPIRLDHDGLFAASVWPSGCDASPPRDFELQAPDGVSSRKKWRLKANGVIPAAMHFNGDRHCIPVMIYGGDMPKAGQPGSVKLDDEPLTDIGNVCGRYACDLGPLLVRNSSGAPVGIRRGLIDRELDDWLAQILK